jgi:hypothetical protein
MTVSERQKERFHRETVARAKADRARGVPFRAPGGTPEVATPTDEGTPVAKASNAPLEQLQAEIKEEAALDPANRLALLEAEIARREIFAERDARIAELDAQIEAMERNEFAENILTTPLHTGIARIDKAGQTVQRTSGSGNFGWQEDLPTMDHLPPEHPDRITADRAARGVEVRKGIPFSGRVKMALELGTPSVQEEIVREVIGDIAANVPPGQPYMQIDPLTGGVNFLVQITPEDEGVYEEKGTAGKYRWVSAESAGINANSIGAVFDLAELGSITGGVVGAVATRNLTFFKNSVEAARGVSELNKLRRMGRGTLGGAGEMGLGLLGREVGNLISLTISKSKGRDIRPDEIYRLFTSDIGKEAAAMVLGRGMSKTFDTIKEATAIGGATMRGNRIIMDNPDAAAKAQTNAEQAVEDTNALNDILEEAGSRERVTVTQAEAETSIANDLVEEGPSGQPSRLVMEENQRINQGGATKEAEALRGVEGRSAHRRLAESFGPATAEGFSPATANQILKATEEMPLRPVPDDPTRGFIAPRHMEYDPNSNVNGLTFQIMPNNTLSIVGAELPEGLHGIGLGSDMYRAYLALGLKEGRQPTSGPMVKGDAMAVWQRMKDEGWDVELHPNAKQMEGLTSWNVVDDAGNTMVGVPVWSLKMPPPFTKDIVATIDALTRSASGRIAKGEQFERFMFHATADELAAVKSEVAGNTLLRADLLGALFENYKKHVYVKGKDGLDHLSSAAREAWFDDADRVLSTVFTPNERLALRQADDPMLFRQLVDDALENRAVLETSYGEVLTKSDISVFRNNKQLLKHINALETAGERKRVWNIMKTNAPEQFEAMQQAVMAEVREQAYKPVKNQTVSRSGQHTFGRWLNANRTMLTEVLGEEYVNNLTKFNRSIARQTVRAGIDGTKKVINPPMLMAARTIMGVMNKWQRRVTAGRRFQMQKWYGRTIDIISDPDKLEKFMSIQELQLRLGPNHKAVVAAAVRLNLVDNEEEWGQYMSFAKQWMTQAHNDYMAEHKDPSYQRRMAERDRVARGNTARPNQ